MKFDKLFNSIILLFFRSDAGIMYRASLTRLVRCASVVKGQLYHKLCMPHLIRSHVLLRTLSPGVSWKRHFYNTSVYHDGDLFTETTNSAGHSECTALNEVIAAMKTIPELLETYKNFRDTAPMDQRNRVTVLHRIASTVQKDQQQQGFLTSDSSQEKSLFLDLLDQLSTHISKSSGTDLATVLWSLGKIQLGSSLASTCDREIVAREISAFDITAVNQILSGLAAFNMKNSPFWAKIENRILSGDMPICYFNNQEIVGSLWAFSKAGKGSKGLFRLYREDIYSRDMSSFTGSELSQLVFSFTKNGIEAEKLFSHTEQEILQKGLKHFCDMKFFLVLWAFANCKSGKSYDQLFMQIDRELASHGVQELPNSDLSNLLWCFSKVGAYDAKVYEAVKFEILARGLENFHRDFHQILWSFAVTKKKQYVDFLEEAASQFICFDMSRIEKRNLCMYAWCFGSLGETNERVFQAIEQELLRSKDTKLDYKHIKMLLSGFGRAKKGSQEFWTFLEAAILKLDFSALRSDDIARFLWPFAAVKYKPSKLYKSVEKEVFQRGESQFAVKELVRMKKKIRF